MGVLMCRRWLSVLVACFLLAWSCPGAMAMTLSGLSSLSKQLTQWLAGSRKFDKGSVSQAIRILDGKKGKITQSALKEAMASLGGDAKNVHEHLSQLETLLNHLNEELDKATSDLKSDGPSLEAVANEETRCSAIRDLQEENRIYSEAVTTIRQISKVLPAIRERADFLKKLLNRQIEYHGYLYENLNWTQALFGSFDPGTAWVNSIYEQQDLKLSENIRKAERKVSVLPELIERRENFDANMETFIDPAAKDSCGFESTKTLREKTHSSYDEAAIGHEDDMDVYSEQTDAIRQHEEGAATARQQRIEEAERARIARNAALEAERTRLRNEYAQARQRGDGGSSFWSTLTDALAISAGVAAGAMQTQTAYAGSDLRCQQARAQVQRYDQFLKQTQGPSYSAASYQRARQQAQNGRNGNLRWVQSNC